MSEPLADMTLNWDRTPLLIAIKLHLLGLIAKPRVERLLSARLIRDVIPFSLLEIKAMSSAKATAERLSRVGSNEKPWACDTSLSVRSLMIPSIAKLNRVGESGLP